MAGKSSSSSPVLPKRRLASGTAWSSPCPSTPPDDDPPPLCEWPCPCLLLLLLPPEDEDWLLREGRSLAWVIQGWMRTSSVVSRSSGFLRRRQRMRQRARDEMESGRLNWPRRILAKRPWCSCPWKGYLK